MLNEREFLDFVYVGAPRAGSNWLAGVLGEHPNVWLPHSKELHFFNDRFVSSFEYKYPHGIDYYRQYFQDAPPTAKLGELSPLYYYDPNAAYRIYTAFPNVRIIAMLRSPVDMIHSLYLLIRNREPRESTFEREIAKHPQLLDLGFYHRLLTPYFDWFPPENLFIGIYEQFFQDEEKGSRDVFQFLGIDDGFKSQYLGKRINATKEERPLLTPYIRGPLIRLLNTKPLLPVKAMIHKLKLDKLKMDFKAIEKRHEKNRLLIPIKPETRARLMEQFERDIARLETMLGVNLSIWRE